MVEQRGIPVYTTTTELLVALPWVELKERIRTRRPSPRVKMAARLHATGAVRTKAEAARVAGLSPAYFSIMTTVSEPTRRLVDEVDEMIQDESVDTSVILKKLGREAIGRIRQLSHGAKSEDIQFRASVDLADRSTETSKVQKHQEVAPMIDPESMKQLAAALVDAAEIRKANEELAKGDFVRVIPEAKQITDGSESANA